jgi:hypothetical protein
MNFWKLYAIIVPLGVTVFLFASFLSKEEPSEEQLMDESNTEMSDAKGPLPQVIKGMDLSKPYDFAGEPVPMDNFDAIERLDRELSINSYLHANTLINIKASRRYFPVIEPILAKHGIPDDFKYIAVAESNLRNETSPAGAKGIWQFVERTAEYYGLEISGDVDERLHLEKSTEAACRYLKDYYTQFGNWTLAAAAYNMGGPSLKNYIEEQRANNYYDLNLNSETSRYIFRIIAIKEILKNPIAFGFHLDDTDSYQPFEYTTVTIDGNIDSWGEFAEQYKTTYRMLKVFNPWLISGKLRNKTGKVYEIKIPLQ